MKIYLLIIIKIKQKNKILNIKLKKKIKLIVIEENQNQRDSSWYVHSAPDAHSIYILTKSHRPKTFLFTKPRMKWPNGNSVFRWSKKEAHMQLWPQAHLYISCPLHAYRIIIFLFIFPLLSALHAWTSFSFFYSSFFSEFFSFTYAWTGSLKLAGLTWPGLTLEHSTSLWMSCVHEGWWLDHIFFFFFSPVLVSM